MNSEKLEDLVTKALSKGSILKDGVQDRCFLTTAILMGYIKEKGIFTFVILLFVPF